MGKYLIISILAGLLAGCAGRFECPWLADGSTYLVAGNDTEATRLVYRGDCLWDEVSLTDGSTRFTFEEIESSDDHLLLVDKSRNGGLSLLIDLQENVVRLSEGAGQDFYVRYDLREVSLATPF